MPDLLKKVKTVWFDHRTDLPDWIIAGIGQAVVEWASVEKELELLIRILIDGDLAQVRILTNKMNARNRQLAIKSLIEDHITHGRLRKRDRARFAAISKKKLGDAQASRDLLAHGLWGKRGSSWCVLQVRESRSIAQLRPFLDNISRVALPQPQPITRARLRTDCKRIIFLAKRLEAFSAHVERALGPLRQVLPGYSRRKGGYRP